MGTRISHRLLCIILLCISCTAFGQMRYCAEVPEETAAPVRLAAREVARYIYLRTGQLPSATGEIRIRLAQRDDPSLPAELREAAGALEGDAYVLRTLDDTHYLVGATPQAVLYAAYAFAPSSTVASPFSL